MGKVECPTCKGTGQVTVTKTGTGQVTVTKTEQETVEKTDEDILPPIEEEISVFQVWQARDSRDIYTLIGYWQFAVKNNREDLKEEIREAWPEIDKSGSSERYTFDEFVVRYVSSKKVWFPEHKSWASLNLEPEWHDMARGIYEKGLQKHNDPYLAACDLSDYVNGLIKYSKEEGCYDFGSTSEMVANRPEGHNVFTGDCSDHTHMLLDLLRGIDIPARKVGVGGIKNDDGKKWGHAVVEAYINGGWVLLDPTNSKHIDRWDPEFSSHEWRKRVFNMVFGPVTYAYCKGYTDVTVQDLIKDYEKKKITL